MVIAFASLVAPKRAVGDEYKLISSLHFLPLNLILILTLHSMEFPFPHKVVYSVDDGLLLQG